MTNSADATILLTNKFRYKQRRMTLGQQRNIEQHGSYTFHNCLKFTMGKNEIVELIERLNELALALARFWADGAAI
jgi:hypothetical protein